MLHGHAYFAQVPVSDTCPTWVLVRHFPNPYPTRTRIFFFLNFKKSGYSPDTVATCRYVPDTADLKKKKKKRRSKILTTRQTTHCWSWFEHNNQLKSPKRHLPLSSSFSCTEAPQRLSLLCFALALSMLSESLRRRLATKEPPPATQKLPLSPSVIERSFSLL